MFLNRWFVGMLILGSVVLGASLLALHFLHLKPCLMCKMQRVPFALLIISSIFGLTSLCKQGFFRMTQACLVLGMLLGGAHFLMQMGALPDFCNTQRGFESPEAFSKMLQTSKCSEVTWSVFGMPISLLNAMIHSAALGVSIWLSFGKG